MALKLLVIPCSLDYSFCGMSFIDQASGMFFNRKYQLVYGE